MADGLSPSRMHALGYHLSGLPTSIRSLTEFRLADSTRTHWTIWTLQDA
jgi:hypothetical protein